MVHRKSRSPLYLLSAGLLAATLLACGPTGGSDTKPDALTDFAGKTATDTSKPVESAEYTVEGIDAPADISISGGEYSVNGGAFKSTPGTVVAGDKVKVRANPAATKGQVVTTTLTIGGVPAKFVVTTGDDTTPNAFTFTDNLTAAANSQPESNEITVAGLSTAAPISINAAGQYSKNGGAYTGAAGTVVNGDKIKVKPAAPVAASSTVNVVLTIGGVSDTYTVTTGLNPTSLTIPGKSGLESDYVISDATASNVTGATTTLSLTGAAAFDLEYSKDGGTTWLANTSDAAVPVSSGSATVKLRALVKNATRTLPVTLGGANANFVVTTLTANTTTATLGAGGTILPDAGVLNSVAGADPLPCVAGGSGASGPLTNNALDAALGFTTAYTLPATVASPDWKAVLGSFNGAAYTAWYNANAALAAASRQAPKANYKGAWDICPLPDDVVASKKSFTLTPAGIAAGAKVQKVTLLVQINHEYRPDLKITLKKGAKSVVLYQVAASFGSPTGGIHVLFNDDAPTANNFAVRCGAPTGGTPNGDCYNNGLPTDNAGTDLGAFGGGSQHLRPQSGPIKPLNPLSAFADDDATGSWTVDVEDLAAGNANADDNVNWPVVNPGTATAQALGPKRVSEAKITKLELKIATK